MSHLASRGAASGALTVLLILGAIVVLPILLRSLGIAIMWRALLELVP